MKDRLPGSLDGKRFLRAMARFGGVVVAPRGSHRLLAHPDHAHIVVVAFHGTLSAVAARRALRLTQIEETESRRAY